MQDQQTPDRIFEQELEYFSSVLEISEKFESEAESMPVSVLHNMVIYRQEWLDKIQELEKLRAASPDRTVSPEARLIMNRITEIVSRLVEIDERIYQHLQNRKLKYIQDHSAMAGQIAQNRKQAGRRTDISGRLNIVQE
jgi:hypothetical protein